VNKEVGIAAINVGRKDFMHSTQLVKCQPQSTQTHYVTCLKFQYRANDKNYNTSTHNDVIAILLAKQSICS